MHARSLRPRSTRGIVPGARTGAGGTPPAGTPQSISSPNRTARDPHRDRYTSSISRIGHLRASDAERDQVAERLRTAATEGRIGFDELEERLTATLASRTYAELEAVLADLPTSQSVAKRTLVPASPVARVAIVVAVAVPLVVAAILVFAAFISAWIVWALIGWYVIGHHRPYRPCRRPYSPRHAHRQARAGPGRGF